MAGDRHGHLPAQCDNGGSLDRSPFDGNGALRIVAALSGVGQRTHRKHFAKRDCRSGSPDRSQIAGRDQRGLDHIIDEGGNAGSGERKQCDPDQRGEDCVRRATIADINLVKDLLNDPVIRPTIGGEGELDPTDLLSDERNICLFDARGGAMFAWRGPGIYEGHSFFRVRGRDAIRVGREIMDEMRQRADLIWGATRLELKAARWFNRQMGFQSLGEIDTPEGRCELFEMRC
jgi:hypothetical protein